MSNLESAKAAIEAEIAHAKQGVEHFFARVEALEKALLHIVAVDGGVLDTQGVVEIPVVKSAKSQPAKYVKKAKGAKGETDLPFTGGDYWPDLITTQPQSGAEILHAAINKLGFEPTKAQVLKLTQRATFAINALVKAGKIQDSGKGRERRFFKN